MELKLKPFYYVTFRYFPEGGEQHEVIFAPTEEIAKIELALKIFEDKVLLLGASKARDFAMSSVCNIEKMERMGG